MVHGGEDVLLNGHCGEGSIGAKEEPNGLKPHIIAKRNTHTKHDGRPTKYQRLTSKWTGEAAPEKIGNRHTSVLGGQPHGVGEASERHGALGLIVLGAGIVDGVVEQRGQGHLLDGRAGTNTPCKTGQKNLL